MPRIHVKDNNSDKVMIVESVTLLTNKASYTIHDYDGNIIITKESDGNKLMTVQPVSPNQVILKTFTHVKMKED